METEQQQLRFFKIRLLFWHPNEDPDAITRGLMLPPFRSWQAGTERFAPNGSKLPGVHRDTRWNHVILCDQGETVSDELNKLIVRCEAANKFISNFVQTGGVVEICLSFPGCAYHGGSLSSQQLYRLAQLNISLGFEVFPDWKLDDSDENDIGETEEVTARGTENAAHAHRRHQPHQTSA